MSPSVNLKVATKWDVATAVSHSASVVATPSLKIMKFIFMLIH
jgi:hypothetical protein